VRTAHPTISLSFLFAAPVEAQQNTQTGGTAVLFTAPRGIMRAIFVWAGAFREWPHPFGVF